MCPFRFVEPHFSFKYVVVCWFDEITSRTNSCTNRGRALEHLGAADVTPRGADSRPLKTPPFIDVARMCGIAQGKDRQGRVKLGMILGQNPGMSCSFFRECQRFERIHTDPFS